MLQTIQRFTRPYLPASVRRRMRLALSFGFTYRCPVCSFRCGKLLPAGKGYDVLERLNVVGGQRIEEDVCPSCFASSRTRLVLAYLRHHTSLFERLARVLHVAPQRGLGQHLRAKSNLRYYPFDRVNPGGNSLFDLMGGDLSCLPFASEFFDAVLCNHVLEHVNDDGLALAELYRVLKPGGFAILQVPIAMRRRKTHEDPAMRPEERILHFGHPDHVRLYGRDYALRLSRAGFEVSTVNVYATLSDEQRQELRLNPNERIYVVRRPKDIETEVARALGAFAEAM